MSIIYATVISVTIALMGTLAPILAEEAGAAESAGSAMGPSIWIVLMVLAVVIAGAVWYATTRIKPPAAHADGHGAAHGDSH